MKTQKPKNIEQILMTIMAIVTLIACQKEYTTIKEPDTNTTIKANDNIADLIAKIALKDGSYDNIIDKCSETNIKYPYTIKIDDEHIKVNSSEDVKNIKLNHFANRDQIEINYPITISRSDYTETTITNAEELQKIQEQYNTNLTDDDIECIDFIYPIEINTYNKKYHKTKRVIAKSDYDMHKIFKNIKDLVIEMDYPITVETQDKKRINIKSNTKLENKIEEEIDTNKDENDNAELNDHDYPHKEVITNKEWKILLYLEKTNQTAIFDTYIFNYKEDNTIEIQSETETVSGKWEMSIHENHKLINIEIATDKTPLTKLNGSWEIKNTNPVIMKMESCSDSQGKRTKIILHARDN